MLVWSVRAESYTVEFLPGQPKAAAEERKGISALPRHQLVFAKTYPPPANLQTTSSHQFNHTTAAQQYTRS